jgi:uncharacterized protein YbjT (DUF2867 family)
MKTLVIGGTGRVGGRVLSGLIEKGVDVRAMTRSPEKAKSFPQGVEAAVADLTIPDSLTRAFAGVGAVFFITPLSETETQEGLHAVEAARKEGVRKLVYSSVALPGARSTFPTSRARFPSRRPSAPPGRSGRSCGRTISTRTITGSRRR